MSLADELLADLDDLDNLEDSDKDIDMEDAETLEIELKKRLKESKDIFTVAKVLRSRPFTELMRQIEHFKQHQTNSALVSAKNFDEVEYQLIVQANNAVGDIEADILLANKFARDVYAQRFPELDQLLPSAIDFARTVKVIGEEEDITKVNLKNLLPSATVMIINVAATTSDGKLLTKEQLNVVLDACDVILQLDQAKQEIHAYVESRMGWIAPNLTCIIDYSTAAKLMGAAGGMSHLSTIPASNLMVVGAQKKTNMGLSILGQERHRGFIYYCETVQSVPAEFRTKAARIVANKVALACRVDAAGESSDGQIGRNLKAQVDKRIEQLLQPPPDKAVRALPAPKEGPKNRRGGRRVRKMKEQYAVTDTRKAANRMAFGEAEAETMTMDGESVGLGMLGQSGNVRVNEKKVKFNPKKSIPGNKSRNPTSGLVTNIAFTPVQGIELSNPEVLTQRDKLKQINERWFSTHGGPTSAKTSGTATAAMLPAPKQ
jgi:U4/U6 small nuclear ribonucleoprotein PRP31